MLNLLCKFFKDSRNDLALSPKALFYYQISDVILIANILKKGLWKVSNVWTKYHFRKFVGMVTDVSLIRKTPFIRYF